MTNLLEELRTITGTGIEEARRRRFDSAGSSIHYGDPDNAYDGVLIDGPVAAAMDFATSVKKDLAKALGLPTSLIRIRKDSDAVETLTGEKDGKAFMVVFDPVAKAGSKEARIDFVITIDGGIVLSGKVAPEKAQDWVPDVVRKIVQHIGKDRSYSIGEATKWAISPGSGLTDADDKKWRHVFNRRWSDEDEAKKAYADLKKKLPNVKLTLGSVLEATADPSDEAATLIKDGSEGNLNRMIERKLSELLDAFKNAQKQQDGLRRIGAGTTEARTLLKPIVRKLREIAQFVSGAADHAVKVGEMREETLTEGHYCDACDSAVEEPEDGKCPECGGKVSKVEAQEEGASPGARSKGTGYGKGETAAAGEFWDKGPTGKKDDKKKFNKAQRSGKEKHIDAQVRGEGLAAELERALFSEADGGVEEAKKLLDMMLAKSPDGHTMSIKDLTADMPAKERKVIEKHINSMISTGMSFGPHGNVGLLWPKDAKGNYDKSKVIVVRGKKGRSPGGTMSWDLTATQQSGED